MLFMSLKTMSVILCGEKARKHFQDSSSVFNDTSSPIQYEGLLPVNGTAKKATGTSHFFTVKLSKTGSPTNENTVILPKKSTRPCNESVYEKQ